MLFVPRDFALHIALGNSDMRTPSDVAGMLRTIAGRLDSHGEFTPSDQAVGFLDPNGTTVGSWTIVGEHRPMDDEDLMEAAHKLSGVTPSDVEEALEQFWGNGVADEEHGGTDEAGGHTFRVERWTLHTDGDGNKTVTEHDSEADAGEVMDDLRANADD